jgi:hypothetical protein
LRGAAAGDQHGFGAHLGEGGAGLDGLAFDEALLGAAVDAEDGPARPAVGAGHDGVGDEAAGCGGGAAGLAGITAAAHEVTAGDGLGRRLGVGLGGKRQRGRAGA